MESNSCVQVNKERLLWKCFMRAVAAYHICSAVEYRGLTLEDAAREMLHAILPSLGGQGGVIAVDASGRVVMDFSSEGMFRGARDSAGRREVAIT